MSSETVSLGDKGQLHFIIEAAQMLKQHGASSNTIESAINATPIPKKLQKSVIILSKDMPYGYRAMEYQQQLIYPSHPNP
jgi:hypothetical protein